MGFVPKLHIDVFNSVHDPSFISGKLDILAANITSSKAIQFSKSRNVGKKNCTLNGFENALGCPRMHQLLKCHAAQGSCDAKFPKFLKSIKIRAVS